MTLKSAAQARMEAQLNAKTKSEPQIAAILYLCEQGITPAIESGNMSCSVHLDKGEYPHSVVLLAIQRLRDMGYKCNIQSTEDKVVVTIIWFADRRDDC